MIARGEVALVAATIGRASGAIDAGLYAALVMVALGTTIVTPVRASPASSAILRCRSVRSGA